MANPTWRVLDLWEQRTRVQCLAVLEIDGDNLLVNADSAQVINPALYAKTGFESDLVRWGKLVKDSGAKID